MLIVGDSLLQGIQANPATIVAKKGLTISKARQLFQRKTVQTQIFRTGVVILHVGTNDLCRFKPQLLARLLIQLRKDLMKTTGKLVYLSALLPRKDEWRSNARETNKILRRLGRDFFLLHRRLHKKGPESSDPKGGVLCPDGLHLTEYGREEFAASLKGHAGRLIGAF